MIKKSQLQRFQQYLSMLSLLDDPDIKKFGFKHENLIVSNKQDVMRTLNIVNELLYKNDAFQIPEPIIKELAVSVHKKLIGALKNDSE